MLDILLHREKEREYYSWLINDCNNFLRIDCFQLPPRQDISINFDFLTQCLHQGKLASIETCCTPNIFLLEQQESDD